MSEENLFQELFREGTALLQRGEAKQAVPVLEKAHRINPEHPDAALNLSGAYILSGIFKRAVPLLESLIRSAPDNAMVWTNLGAAYLGNPVLATNEQQQSAIAAFKRALDINPVATSVAYNIGLIYRDRNELEKAIIWFRRAIQANPNDRDAHSLLARLEAKVGSNG